MTGAVATSELGLPLFTVGQDAVARYGWKNVYVIMTQIATILFGAGIAQMWIAVTILYGVASKARRIAKLRRDIVRLGDSVSVEGPVTHSRPRKSRRR